uniref:Uncharacterized protein n=1 Tax=Anopheles maculatus TaxID=74869 RepID=A0A182SM69_9DIPT
MLLSSRIGTSAYDLLQLLPLLQRDDVALAEAAGPLSTLHGTVTCLSSLSLAGLPNQATVAGLFEGADHCQLFVAHEAHACRPTQSATGNGGGSAQCSKSSINEAYYNLDKLFA